MFMQGRMRRQLPRMPLPMPCHAEGGHPMERGAGGDAVRPARLAGVHAARPLGRGHTAVQHP